MTKSITDLAREAGFLLHSEPPKPFMDALEHFAALHRFAILAELTGEMPEPVAQLHPAHWKPNPDGSEWCREALLYSPNNEGDKLRGVNQRVKLVTLDQLREYAAADVLKEREACALLCVDEAWRLKQIAVKTNSAATNTASIQASKLADAIRARGNV
jgi:hypothetical protein